MLVGLGEAVGSGISVGEEATALIAARQKSNVDKPEQYIQIMLMCMLRMMIMMMCISVCSRRRRSREHAFQESSWLDLLWPTTFVP